MRAPKIDSVYSPLGRIRFFGATYMVVSPEHPLIEKYKASITNLDEVTVYREAAARKSDFERTELNKEKTGVELKGLHGH